MIYYGGIIKTILNSTCFTGRCVCVELDVADYPLQMMVPFQCCNSLGFVCEMLHCVQPKMFKSSVSGSIVMY